MQFPNWKRGIVHRGKEIKDLSGVVQMYAAQTRPQIEAAMTKKGRFRTETSWKSKPPNAGARQPTVSPGTRETQPFSVK